MKPRSRRAPGFIAAAVSVVFLNQLFSSGDFVEQKLQALPSAVSIELAVLVLLFGLFARETRPPALGFWLLALASVMVFVLRAFSIGVPWFFGRDLNVAVDARFVPFFVKLLYDATPAFQFALLVAAVLLALIAVLTIVRAAYAVIWRSVVLQGRAGLALGFAVVVAGWWAMPTAPSSPDPRPFASLDAGRAVFAAVDSVLRAEGIRGAFRQQVATAQAALPARSDFAPLGGRSVFLIFVESYGAITARDPAFAAVLDPLRKRLDDRLQAAGFARATGLLRSPITGGGSWMAHGTVISGVRIAAQDAYEVMLVSGARTLAHRMKEAGYRTYALMPRIDQPWPEGRLLGFEDIRLQPDLGYAGPRFAWESLPDQWVLDHFARSDFAPRGMFAKIILSSSHTPFDHVPAWVEDWSKLPTNHAYDGLPAREFPVRAGQVFEQDEGYVAATAYSLESAIRFATDRTQGDPLFIVLGDHQPPLTTARRTGDFSSIVHVFSRNAALVDAFVKRGYLPGMQPPPGRAEKGMETFLADFLADFGGAP
ncbi:MAG: hypothetical protein JNN22_01685 [Rhodospirillales bacterium]|nr:hypothetical protein [Rhodospirillales bacterium]